MLIDSARVKLNICIPPKITCPKHHLATLFSPHSLMSMIIFPAFTKAKNITKYHYYPKFSTGKFKLSRTANDVSKLFTKE